MQNNACQEKQLISELAIITQERGLIVIKIILWKWAQFSAVLKRANSLWSMRKDMANEPETIATFLYMCKVCSEVDIPVKKTNMEIEKIWRKAISKIKL